MLWIWIVSDQGQSEVQVGRGGVVGAWYGWVAHRWLLRLRQIWGCMHS